MTQTAEERTINLPGIPAPPPVARKTRNTVKKRAEALRDRARASQATANRWVSLTAEQVGPYVDAYQILQALNAIGVADCAPDTSTIQAT